MFMLRTSRRLYIKMFPLRWTMCINGVSPHSNSILFGFRVCIVIFIKMESKFKTVPRYFQFFFYFFSNKLIYSIRSFHQFVVVVSLIRSNNWKLVKTKKYFQFPFILHSYSFRLFSDTKFLIFIFFQSLFLFCSKTFLFTIYGSI